MTNLNRINLKKIVAFRYIIIKLLKIYIQKVLKWQKKLVKTIILMATNFSSGITEARRLKKSMFKVLKENNSSLKEKICKYIL